MFVDKSIPTIARPNKIAVIGNNQTIDWNIEFYGGASSVDFDGVFQYVNGYIKTLPPESVAVITNAYADARQAISGVSDFLQLQHMLTDITATLYSVIDIGDMQDYILNKSGMRIPSTIKHTYEELEISNRDQSENDYKKKTFLFDEYVDLLSLSLYIRFMVPIWAEHMGRMDGEINNNHKELYALSLFSKTKIHSQPAYVRLSEYIETIVIQGKSIASAVIDGMGTSEIPTWRMATVLVRKLCVIALNPTDDSANVASIVYWCVKNLIKSIDRKHAGYVREKDKPSGSDADGDKGKSIIETYKIRQEISDGDVIPISIYAENPVRVAKDIDPTVPEALVLLCHNALVTRGERMFLPWQENVMAWFINDPMSCWSKDNISYNATIACFAATQAVLWHWGQLHIALLLTAVEARDNEGRLIGGIESKARISNEHVARFKTLYPYYQAQVNSRTTDRQTNIGCKATDSLAIQLVRCDWKPTCPVELLNAFTTQNVELAMSYGNVIVPSDIRHMLSVMLEKLITHQEGIQ